MSTNRIKPGITVSSDEWEQFRKKVGDNNASKVIQNFISNFQPTSSITETSIIQVNKEIWQNFKDKYQDIAIQEVERLMQLAISSPSAGSNVMSVNTAFVNSVSIPAADNWNVNYANNSINLTQIANNTTVTTTGASYIVSGSVATTSTPNILIDLNGDLK